MWTAALEDWQLQSHEAAKRISSLAPDFQDDPSVRTVMVNYGIIKNACTIRPHLSVLLQCKHTTYVSKTHDRVADSDTTLRLSTRSKGRACAVKPFPMCCASFSDAILRVPFGGCSDLAEGFSHAAEQS